MTAITRTLPDHERCDNHRRYRLSCGQYEGLLKRSGGSCEICRRPLARGPHGKLAIDHCGPLWAVRGLLCNGCNASLGDGTSGWESGIEFLANAWWRRRCAVLGLPETLSPEPPIGSAILNQWGTVYVRVNDGPWQAGTGRPRTGWRYLFEQFGPHNLIPYDLVAAHRNNSMPGELRGAIESRPDWSAIRDIVGAPAPLVLREPGESDQPTRESLPWMATPETAACALGYFFSAEELRHLAELLETKGNRP